MPDRSPPFLVIDDAVTTPAYVQIMDQIRTLAREGTLPPRAALPSVRQLARDLSINPNTVAKAYMLLEREGTVRTSSRRGTFVADSAPDRAQAALERRLQRAVDRILEDAASVGVNASDLLEALRRRVGAADERVNDQGGQIP